MNPTALTLEVDAYIATGSKRIRFPAAIEAIFNEQRRRYRARALGANVWPSIACYNLFLPADCFLLPATAQLSIVLHVVVTAWIAIAGLIFKAQPQFVVRELVGVSMPTLMIVQILTIYALNTSSAAADYQYFAIMIVVFMNANLRPDFRFAAATSVLHGLLYAAVIWATGAAWSTKLVGSSSMLMAIYISLSANWRMERDARHAFVRGLKDRLRREEAEAEADRDALTGLFNRRHLDVAAARIWSDVGVSVAAIMLDVDHFKSFNDRYGHPAGDQCLKRVAGAIVAEIRGAGDIAMRFGGEEFLVLLPGADIGAALKVAERIRRSVESCAIPHEGAGPHLKVTVSLGATAGQSATFAAAELIGAADRALYAAKRNGRNQIWPPFVEASATITSLAAAKKSVA